MSGDVAARAKAALVEYRRARRVDASALEPVNCGNDAGDSLAAVVPGLVAEVERLRAAVERVRALTMHWAESEDIAAALDGGLTGE